MSKVALIIIDAQNEFFSKGGKFFSENMRAVIPCMQKLLEEARKTQVPIIFTQDTQWADKPSQDTLKHGDHCLEGTWAWKIIEELTPKEGEFIAVSYTHLTLPTKA